MAGRVITVLVDEPRDAVDCTETWLGRDSRGRRVGSGVYFVRLEVGEVVATERVVFLK